MTKYEWLLFVHVAGGFILVSGAVVAAAMQLAAMRRERPSEIALLLRVSRVGVVLVGLGSAIVLAFGIWLAEYLGYGVGEGWVLGAIVLWAVSMALGGAGGRSSRHARYLAERLAREGDRPNEQLRRLVADRLTLSLNYGSGLAVLAILALMIWRPG